MPLKSPLIIGLTSLPLTPSTMPRNEPIRVEAISDEYEKRIAFVLALSEY